MRSELENLGVLSLMNRSEQKKNAYTIGRKLREIRWFSIISIYLYIYVLDISFGQ